MQIGIKHINNEKERNMFVVSDKIYRIMNGCADKSKSRYFFFLLFSNQTHTHTYARINNGLEND